MENKSIFKKIALIVILIAIIVGIVAVAVNASSGKKTTKTNTNNNGISKPSVNTSDMVEQTTNKNKNPKITELEDGRMYSLVDEDIVVDFVIGDNYFDTQIADIMLNFNEYEGKTIEIEGLYFANNPYTFVGRYSTSNICPDCPTGYSYIEYEWNGTEAIPLKDEQDWIKVIGTLKKGNDGVEYYYIEVAKLEVMNEKGLTTVSN